VVHLPEDGEKGKSLKRRRKIRKQAKKKGTEIGNTDPYLNPDF